MGLRYLENVVSLMIHVDKCRGCGMCTVVCPHSVWRMADHKAVMEDKDACMECGACAQNCPFKAIEVKAGVGCAYAVINGMFKSGKPTCGCG